MSNMRQSAAAAKKPAKKGPQAHDAMLAALLGGTKGGSSASAAKKVVTVATDDVSIPRVERKRVPVIEDTTDIVPSVASSSIAVVSAEDMMTQVTSMLTRLADSNNSVRRQTLERLTSLLTPSNWCDDEASSLVTSITPTCITAMTTSTPSSIIAIYERSGIVKELIKRLADPVERCRELAVRIILHGICVIPSATSWLMYLIPAMQYRLAPAVETESDSQASTSSSVARTSNIMARMESAEEVRSVLMCIMRVLTIRCGRILEPHFADIALILHHTLMDRCPSVFIETCSCLVLLCDEEALPHLMKGPSPIMAKLAMVGLHHKQSLVRIAAIQALAALIPCGSHELIRDMAGYREHNMIVFDEFFKGDVRHNYMARCVTDDNGRVRRTFFTMINHWMTKLSERFDYETLIMPYMLSGLFDDDKENRDAALATLTTLGREYEEDHKEELKDVLFYGQQAEDDMTHAHLAALPALLPVPFIERPGVGMRIVAKRFISRFMPAILNELADWKEGTQQRSVLLLRTMLVLSEHNINQYTQELIIAFQRLSLSHDLRKEARYCMALVGRYADPYSYMPVLLRIIRGQSGGEMERRRQGLVVMKYLLRGAAPLTIEPHLYELLDALLDEDLREAVTVPVVMAVLRLIHQICRIDCSDVFIQRTCFVTFSLCITLTGWLQSGLIVMTRDQATSLIAVMTRIWTLYRTRLGIATIYTSVAADEQQLQSIMCRTFAPLILTQLLSHDEHIWSVRTHSLYQLSSLLQSCGTTWSIPLKSSTRVPPLWLRRLSLESTSVSLTVYTPEAPRLEAGRGLVHASPPLALLGPTTDSGDTKTVAAPVALPSAAPLLASIIQRIAAITDRSLRVKAAQLLLPSLPSLLPSVKYSQDYLHGCLVLASDTDKPCNTE